jgi:hypothetical protein
MREITTVGIKADKFDKLCPGIAAAFLVTTVASPRLSVSPSIIPADQFHETPMRYVQTHLMTARPLEATN